MGVEAGKAAITLGERMVKTWRRLATIGRHRWQWWQAGDGSRAEDGGNGLRMAREGCGRDAVPPFPETPKRAMFDALLEGCGDGEDVVRRSPSRRWIRLFPSVVWRTRLVDFEENLYLGSPRDATVVGDDAGGGVDEVELRCCRKRGEEWDLCAKTSVFRTREI